MPTTFEPDRGRIKAIVDALLEKYRGELLAAGVRFDLLLAYAAKNQNGEAVGPAIKANGYAAAATVRILSLKDRAKGMGDAEIVVDGDRIDEWSAENLEAILDHEVEHVDLVLDGEGSLKRDDLGRPKLRLRLHDRQMGWFDSVARRHGLASLEVAQASRFVAVPELRQLYLPGLGVDVEIEAERPRRNVSDEEQARADGLMRRMGHKVEGAKTKKGERHASGSVAR
jgi:hypothetical protein